MEKEKTQMLKLHKIWQQINESYIKKDTKKYKKLVMELMKGLFIGMTFKESAKLHKLIEETLRTRGVLSKYKKIEGDWK